MQAGPKPKPQRPSRLEAADRTRRAAAESQPPQIRPGAPNGWRRGRVLRTLWPAAAGTQRWLKRYGAALVCVRHREDPAGLRRVVTVELLVGEVRSQRRPRRLNAQALYPLRLPPGARGLRQLLQAHGARQDSNGGVWYARGHLIDALDLLDWVLLPSPIGTKG